MTTIVRYLYTCSRVTKIKKTDNTKHWREGGGTGPHALRLVIYDGAATFENIVSSEVTRTLTLNTSKTIHRYLLKGNEMLNRVYRKICAEKFIAVLFIPTNMENSKIHQW